MDEWWRKEENEIKEIENDSYNVKYLCGHETEDGWEYAIVNWRFKIPTLNMLFTKNKILYYQK